MTKFGRAIERRDGPRKYVFWYADEPHVEYEDINSFCNDSDIDIDTLSLGAEVTETGEPRFYIMLDITP
jgi:hypothetical protein